jgi:hypothetical protein
MAAGSGALSSVAEPFRSARCIHVIRRPSYMGFMPDYACRRKHLLNVEASGVIQHLVIWRPLF